MLGENLIAFALRVYADPAVAETCLRLQDEHGADVNLILLACWLAAHRVALPPEEAADADARLHGWRISVIEPLRGVRRYLKPIVAEREGADLLREKIKEAELAAEMMALRLLEDVMAGQIRQSVTQASQLLRIANVTAVVSLARPTNEPARLIAKLCSAVEAIER